MDDITVKLRRGFGGIVPPVCDEAANEIDLLRQLLAEAPKFFAPQHDFEGEKLEWLKRAELIANVTRPTRVVKRKQA